MSHPSHISDDELRIERFRVQLSAVRSPQAVHSAAAQDFGKKQAALRRIEEGLAAKEAALAKVQGAISQLREQQAEAQAELRAASQKMSATNFALTSGPLAIPKLDDRFTADKPELRKFMADPGFKLWQDALEEQAAARQEAEKIQATEAAAKATTKSATDSKSASQTSAAAKPSKAAPAPATKPVANPATSAKDTKKDTKIVAPIVPAKGANKDKKLEMSEKGELVDKLKQKIVL